MGFALPSGVVNTGSLYVYAPAAGAAPLGPYVKHVGDQILVVIDYTASGGTPVASFSFAVDVSSNPQLVIAYPQIDSTGHTLSFLLSGGIVGQQYNITINTQYTVSPGVTAPRAYHLIISIPSSDGDVDIINPVPAIYNQIPLWGGGYVNTAVRAFWGPVAPSNPNVLDRWLDTTNGVFNEWVTDGTNARWLPVFSGSFVTEAPLDGQLYSRGFGTWVLTPIPSAPVQFGATPPTVSPIGGLWFDDTAAQMYVLYRDVNGTTAWVPVVNQAGAAGAPPPSPTVPANTAAPVVTGTGAIGSTLATTNGSWTNSPTTFAYQWTRNGSNISGAAASTYVLVSADGGQNIRCIVTASNTSGSANATSNALTILPTAPVNSVPPVISGSTTLGSTLTTTDGTWNGGPTFTYLWQRDGVIISGATATTYVVVSADQGHSLNAVVTATNVAGSGSMSSNNLAIPAFAFPATNLKALYSIRKVGASYSGPCLKVWRGSDSATLDVGFAATGLVDYAAALAFFGGTPQPMYVQKWYDQSGASLDLDWGAGSPNRRPQLNLMNGKPWLSFVKAKLRSTATPVLNADMTVGCVAQIMSDIVSVPFSQFDGTNGWFLFSNGSAVDNGSVGATPGNMNFFSSQGGVVIADAGRYFADTNRYVAKRGSGNATIYVNGTQTATSAAANGGTGSTPITIGQDVGGLFYFYGLLGEMYAYGSTAGAGGALSDANRLAIDTNQAAAFPDLNFHTPYSGTSSLEFGLNEYINCGPVLNYERTVSWTAFAAVQLFASSTFNSGDLMVFYTNVPAAGPAYPGHEMWIDEMGRIRVRIISNYGSNIYLGVIGTTYLADGKKHTVAYSYNGSSLASGVKIYIDGLPESTTVEIDALSASIIGGTQNLYIGSQNGFIAGDMTLGTMSFFQIDNVVRSASYIATNFTGGGQLPLADANTDLRLLLNAGSGTTAADTSGHSRNGTLASATMWVP